MSFNIRDFKNYTVSNFGALENIFANRDNKYTYDDLLNAINDTQGTRLNAQIASRSTDDPEGYMAEFDNTYGLMINDFLGRAGIIPGDGQGDDKDKKDKVGKVEGTGVPLNYEPSEQTQFIEGIKGRAAVPGKSVRDIVGPDYVPKGAGRGVGGLENFAARYGAGKHLGESALGEALLSGYTLEGLRQNYNRHDHTIRGVRTAAWRGNQEPLKVMGRAREALNNPGQIYEFYGQGSGPDHINRRNFGDSDYNVHRAQGFSNLAIKEYLDRNPNKLSSNNRMGVAGGLYERIKAQLPKAIPGIPGIAGVPAKNLLIGGSKIGEGAYAKGIKSNRSLAYRSGRSSMGTSQYRRT